MNCLNQLRSNPFAIAAYNRLLGVFVRPIGACYGRLLFDHQSKHMAYFPMSLAAHLLHGSLTIQVDPRRISRRVPYPFREMQRRSRACFVWHGEWDVEAEMLDDDKRFIDMNELALNERSYKESAAYVRMVAALNCGRPESPQRIFLGSVPHVNDYFENKLRLFESLRTSGYRSQSELGLAGDEIGVAIGRKGEMLKYYHGHHRLAISKALGLGSVSVSVQMAHHKWVQQCCATHGGPPLIAIRKGMAELALDRWSESRGG